MKVTWVCAELYSTREPRSLNNEIDIDFATRCTSRMAEEELDNSTRDASSPPTLGGSGSYAFLNHSSNTLTYNLPPYVDDKPLARQKRRRTR